MTKSLIGVRITHNMIFLKMKRNNDTIMKNIYFYLFIIIILSLSNQVIAEGIVSIEDIGKPYPFHQPITIGAIRAYQIFISPSKGTYCPMHPHCSLYALEAFKNYNPLRAFFMTADRLHRCGHDLGNYKTVEVGELVRFYDPIDTIHNSTIKRYAGLKESGYLQGSLRTTSVTLNEKKDSFPETEQSQLFLFAKVLQSEGYYDFAIIELRRLLFYNPSSQYKNSVLLSIFRCHFQKGDYLSAINYGQEIMEKEHDFPFSEELKFYMGLSYFKSGNYSQTREKISELILDDNSLFHNKSLLLEGQSFAYEYRWNEAEKSFSMISTNSELSLKAEQFKVLSKNGSRLPLRKPVIAGFLSIIPGTGYLYDGFAQTAFSSFIVNSLFFSATYEAFKKDQNNFGMILSILSIGWYGGNIYGSVISAERKNIKLKNDLLKKIDIDFLFL